MKLALTLASPCVKVTSQVSTAEKLQGKRPNFLLFVIEVLLG
jgi:hypothetical protein